MSRRYRADFAPLDPCKRDGIVSLYFGALSTRRYSWLSLVRAPSPSFQRSLRSALALALLRQPRLVRRGPRCVRSHSSVTHSLLLSAGWSSTVAVDQLYGYMGDRANALNSTFQSASAVGRMWCKINTWDHLIIHNHRLPYKRMYKEGGLH